jgi:hypothetical protein
MRLPRFLEFLRPRLERKRIVDIDTDRLKLVGHVKIERQRRGGPVELVYDAKNFIVNSGITAIRDVLIGVNGGGFAGSIFRMAVGDGGTPPEELFNPKIPDATWPARTTLFHEVIRQDISVFETPQTNSMRFVASFNSVDVDLTSYSLAELVVNEAALIIGDGILTVGDDKKQVNKAPPDSIDADEKMVSMRTFKSASFDPAEDVTITITWTITVGT